MRGDSQARIARALLLVLLAGFTGGAWSDDGIEFFEKRIRPVLAEHCYECHSAESEKLKGGLRLDTRQGLLRGGDSGPALVAGAPEESLLITAVNYGDKDLQMPPPKDDSSRKLRDAQIRDLTEWVKLGAPMPNDAAPVADQQRTGRDHWAFRPVTNPTPPAVSNAGWAKTEIDAFILAKLEVAGLRPSPPADKRTLLRRATFDLLGLPPSETEVADFLNDSSSDAFGKVIDRLLASPQYGERWGRHWLDLARYADTKGYVYAREERFFAHAYVYRDWVIRAFNENLPYDRFLLLQIAADQLVPADSPDLAAMGFLTGGRRFIGVTHDIIDDRIDVVTRGTMALTVACARCHDHKFDPVPIEDYYSLYGVFRDAVERLLPIGPSSAPSEAFAAYEKEHDVRAEKLAKMMRKRRDEAASRLRARVAEYLAAQIELSKYPEEGFDQILTAEDVIPASVRRWRDFLDKTKNTEHRTFAPWHAFAKLSPGDFQEKAAATGKELSRLSLNPRVASSFSAPPRSMREVAERYGKLFAEVEQQGRNAVEAARASSGSGSAGLPDPIAEELRKFLYDPQSPTTVPDVDIVDNELFFPTSVCEELWKLQAELDRWIIQTPAAPPHARILVDREPERNPRVFKRGSPARAGEEVPRRFLQVIAGPNAQPFQRGSGRLEFAQAIVRADNPLTARVMVNRIWLQHFGAGLVRTPSDFGVRADAPSHPELLDWLAQRFAAGGWDVKEMHRLIMRSAVYQQGSVATEGEQSAARQAGTLDPDNRLLSRFNRRRLDFEQLRDALLAVTGELDNKLGGKPGDMLSPANKRRSVYGLVDRQFLPGTFRVFDFANPDLHIAQRHETTVPQQALFLLNHAFIADRAKALAACEGIGNASSSEDRVGKLYQRVTQRLPTTRDMTVALDFINDAEAAHEGSLSSAETGVAAAWNSKQEFIGPPAPYTPPLRPWEQFAQVLLLSNEFMFVD